MTQQQKSEKAQVRAAYKARREKQRKEQAERKREEGIKRVETRRKEREGKKKDEEEWLRKLIEEDRKAGEKRRAPNQQSS